MVKYWNIVIIFLVIMFFPIVVCAKTKCEVISGNGKNIGDEIACGTEHFYVIENDGENIKMFAKYNIRAGYTQVSINTTLDSDFCQSKMQEDNGMVLNHLSAYRNNECVYKKNLSSDNVILQDKRFNEPRVETVNGYTITYYDGVQSYSESESHYANLNSFYEAEGFGDFSIYRANHDFRDYLQEYLLNLRRENFDIESIDFLSLGDLENIIKKINGNQFSYSEWKSGIDSAVGNLSSNDFFVHYTFVNDIDSQYSLQDYSWLYNSSYWLRSYFKSYYAYSSLSSDSRNGNMFIGVNDKKLELVGCDLGAGYSDANFGFRPVVTISAKTMGEMPAEEEEEPLNGCTVLSGNGKNIGDEVMCGTDYFYVVSSNENETKMLAKYNLMVGVILNKEKISKLDSDASNDFYYCQDLAASKGGNSRFDSFYDTPGYCYTSIPISAKQVRQNKNAISAHWDEDDNYVYPQIGDVYIMADTGSQISDFKLDVESAEKYNNYFYDLELYNGQIFNYLQEYKDFLDSYDSNIKFVNMLTMDDINSIIKKSGKSIPYGDWYNHTREIVPPHFEFGSLRDYLSSKESFLYSTTYWLRTGYDRSANSSEFIGVDNVSFVNTNGGVCGSGVNSSSYLGQNCQTFLRLQSALGAGIRPVIIVENNKIKYLIKTKIVGEGTIEVVRNSLGGEEIQFNITVNKGYKLEKINITTDSGEKVEFKEGEIKKNSDGTYTIDKNKFTMPFESIMIEGIFVPDGFINPMTGNIFLIMLLFLGLFLGLMIKFYFRKNIKY